MKWYKCFINAENFPGELASSTGLVGFFTTLFVKADSEEKAEIIALADLKNDKRLSLPNNVLPPKNARVYFEKIEHIAESEVPAKPLGFTFYVMKAS